MLNAIPAGKLPIVAAIVAAAVIHYVLAVLSTYRLFKFKPKLLPDVVWHILIQVAVIAGPAFFLIAHSRNNKPRIDAAKLKKESEESEAGAAAEQEGNTVKKD